MLVGMEMSRCLRGVLDEEELLLGAIYRHVQRGKTSDIHPTGQHCSAVPHASTGGIDILGKMSS